MSPSKMGEAPRIYEKDLKEEKTATITRSNKERFLRVVEKIRKIQKKYLGVCKTVELSE